MQLVQEKTFRSLNDAALRSVSTVAGAAEEEGRGVWAALLPHYLRCLPDSEFQSLDLGSFFKVAKAVADVTTHDMLVKLFKQGYTLGQDLLYELMAKKDYDGTVEQLIGKLVRTKSLLWYIRAGRSHSHGPTLVRTPSPQFSILVSQLANCLPPVIFAGCRNNPCSPIS